MPYRRLPNTDAARLKALRTALNKGSGLSPFDSAISSATLHKVKTILPQFENEMVQLKTAFSTQVSKNKEYIELQKKARLYISHFLQVMNFSIARGELPVLARIYYGLSESSSRVPLLNTEAEIIKWGSLVIKGETERIAKGGNIITNPTSALVKVWYEKYCDAFRYQKSLQKTTCRALNNVSQLRSEVDIIILHAWNEAEEKFSNLSDAEKRASAMEYGVIYVFRKNESDNVINDSLGEERAIKFIESAQPKTKLEEEDMLQYTFIFPENQEN